jgi:hypothetical protein
LDEKLRFSCQCRVQAIRYLPVNFLRKIRTLQRSQ